LGKRNYGRKWVGSQEAGKCSFATDGNQMHTDKTRAKLTMVRGGSLRTDFADGYWIRGMNSDFFCGGGDDSSRSFVALGVWASIGHFTFGRFL
jgi:hypothetical protein